MHPGPIHGTPGTPTAVLTEGRGAGPRISGTDLQLAKSQQAVEAPVTHLPGLTAIPF